MEASRRPVRRSRALPFAGLYLLLVIAPVASTGLVLLVGAGRHPSAAPSGGPTVSPRRLPVVDPGAGIPDLLLLLGQIVVILAVAWGTGRLLRRFGQPAVVGEMAAGIMLGPSLFGRLAPGLSVVLFPVASLGHLQAISQIGLVLFMFAVGLELDPKMLREGRQAAILTSHASISAPFFLGSALALVLFPSLAGAGAGFAPFALFMGAAMSVTAFPVLARILMERGLVGSRLGAIAIACAAIDDVTAWCILAVVAALVRGSSSGLPIGVTLVGTAVFAGLMLTGVRRALSLLDGAFVRDGRLTTGMAAVVVGAALGAAWVTEWLGVHALFGAFIAGAVMPKRPELVRAILDRLRDLLVVLLLPLFFVLTGLRTHLELIHGARMWVVAGIIVVTAIAGKLGGSALAARLSGLTPRESVALGILMNTRGLIELVFLNIGLELGILSPALFAMMVMMAL
ncbi:MAG TPA: cation:proton antiporter, partial [Candidatus Polarisedimenticolia bacterium]